jgi:hypothetical protein
MQTTFDWKLYRKWPLVRLTRRLKNTIKMYVGEMGCEDVNWIELAEDHVEPWVLLPENDLNILCMKTGSLLSYKVKVVLIPKHHNMEVYRGLEIRLYAL